MQHRTGDHPVHHIIELHHRTPVLCEVSAYCCAECDAQGPGSYQIERHKLATNHTLRWVRFPLREGELVKSAGHEACDGLSVDARPCVPDVTSVFSSSRTVL